MRHPFSIVLPSLLTVLAISGLTEGCRRPTKPVDTGDTIIGYDSMEGSDLDGDGYVSTDAGGDDCDDANAAVNPGTAEVPYDGLDNDCNAETPDDDLDGDGFPIATDCADEDPTVNPSAIEVCDGIDNDCDGHVDNAADAAWWYRDDDADGYGQDLDALAACEQPDGYAPVKGDCDDTDPAFNPGADESDCSDPNDYNCDGSVGYDDADADGFPACEDCDDSLATVNPDGTEVCNNLDDDCDGAVDDYATDATTWYQDDDADNYGVDTSTLAECDQPAGYAAVPGDCNDADPAYNPGASEVCSDPNDYNCDGSVGYADLDGDGFAACNECNDEDAAVNPDAVEICNGIDDNCDGVIDGADASGAITWYLDLDGDGFGDDGVAVTACEAPTYYVATSGDCDDHDNKIKPGATEVCDGYDNDCNGLVDEAGGTTLYYTDADSDGYGDAATALAACAMPTGSVATGTDCDDTDAAYHPGAAESCTDTVDYNCDGSIGLVDNDGDGYAACEECDDSRADVNPGASEVCNGLDDDCNGTIDDGAADMATWYQDSDLDGYGSTTSVTQCDAPAGYIADGGDCDDTNRRVNPSASEVCDGVDNDCDGLTDDASSAGAQTWYVDDDGDGYGDSSIAVTQCDAPLGYASNDTDCNDSDSTVYPTAPESCTDTTDKNCDGYAGRVDSDGDGYAACEECNDGSATSYPGAPEYCDGLDNDCNGLADDSAADASTWYQDSDVDGYGSSVSIAACAQPSGYTSDAGDCNDANRRVNPSAVEICDSIDNDCDGLTDDASAVGSLVWYADADGDGYGDTSVSVSQCGAPSGYVSNDTDCDDGDPTVYPAAPESCTDLTDKNCDGSAGYVDRDGDGYAACEECDDARADVNPAATEVCDGIDNDCDGTVDAGAADATAWYRDTDADGYGTTLTSTSCTQPSGYTAETGDCDDTNRRVNPSAVEICDAIDNDCDGLTDDASAVGSQAWYADADGDGYGDASISVTQCGAPTGYVSNNTDCNDADPTVYPAAPESCTDLGDKNCDGSAGYVDRDGDGYAACQECDDTRADVNPAATEICDGIDNDCDGTVDASAVDASTWYRDADADGYGTTVTSTSCSQPSGYTAETGDCDDGNRRVNPSAAEICDSIDNNCDGLTDGADASGAGSWYDDADSDGYGDPAVGATSCAAPSGYVGNATDCDDANPGANPSEIEVCDGFDDNCDGLTDDSSSADAITYYTDADADGYGSSRGAACTPPTGSVSVSGDCNDADAAINPSATDTCDYVDNDCSGVTDDSYRSGLKYVLSTDCGSCDNDCSTYSYDNATPYCDTTRSTPACEYTCDSGYFDVNGAQADGCECHYISATDAPFDGVDADCDGSDGPPTVAVYVSTTGSPTGAGDISDPVDTIQGGIDLAEASGIDYVIVAEGTYTEDVVLVDGINVYGGYDSSYGSRDIGTYTTRIDGIGANAENPATVLASGISSSTIFEGFTVMGNAASGYGESAVAMWLEDCTDSLVIRSNHLEAGAGRDGRDGANGSTGTRGATGTTGTIAGTGNCSSLPAGGGGGTNTCGGVSTTGGTGGGTTCPSNGVYEPSGIGGIPSGGTGGAGACSAVIYSTACGTAYVSTCWDAGADAADGADGTAGSGGTGATDADGSVASGYWVGAAGSDGTPGTYGRGGGGGGTGSGVDVSSSCGSKQYGGTGGGGGAGGCGGVAGAAGGAGGASIGLVLNYSATTTVFPVLEDNVIVGGGGGFGGDGGDGGRGGAGGLGAAGGIRETTHAWAAQPGGAGGEGGTGGGGGGAGGGAGGPSYAALAFGATPGLTYLTISNTLSHGVAGAKGRGGLGGDASAGDGVDGVDGTSGNQNW